MLSSLVLLLAVTGVVRMGNGTKSQGVVQLVEKDVADGLDVAWFGVLAPVVLVNAVLLLEAACLEFGETAEMVVG